MLTKNLQRITDERRLKIVYIDICNVLGWFTTPHNIPVKKYDLPDNCTVLDVHYDFARRAFAFIIASEDFDPVVIGGELPALTE